MEMKKMMMILLISFEARSAPFLIRRSIPISILMNEKIRSKNKKEEMKRKIKQSHHRRKRRKIDI